MNKVRIGLKALVAISIIAAIFFVAPTVGRFVPTHKIVEPVYCGSCHPEQVGELAATTHLGSFARAAQKMAQYPWNGPEGKRGYGYNMSDAEAISSGCQMCHNYWENFKWFGVVNISVVEDQHDEPDASNTSSYDPIYDIYGNPVSPYGLGSTKSFILKLGTNDIFAPQGVLPWSGGLDVWQYTKDGETVTRLDYVWSNLSAKSPGPVGFQLWNYTNGTLARTRGASRYVSCGTAEKGMCHIAENAVAMSAADKKLEYPNQTKLGGKAANEGAGVFYTHEMAYTTAQYAAKPVKICGACHVFKLPPMKWGGEPWAGSVVRANSVGIPYGEKGGWWENNPVTDLENLSASNALNPGGPEHNVEITDPAVRTAVTAGLSDPFGFTPTYDQTGHISWNRDGEPSMEVYYRTPDWAHQIVPCIRCHTHAGINGESVSDKSTNNP